MRGKKGFEIQFSWIFAVIVGGIIIFLAIYATVSFINTSEERSYTETAAQIRNYLSPIVSGIASAETLRPIEFDQETKTLINCEVSNSRYVYGREKLSFSEKSGFRKRWGEPGANISTEYKFVFSNDTEQGTILYFSETPFSMGFKVDDLIFMSSSRFCFISPPTEIEDIASTFNNVNVTNSLASCLPQEIRVCFGFTATDCNSSVYSSDNYETGYVLKQGMRLDFVGNLIYGAIFASPNIYDCNLQRLGTKISEMSYLYKDKIDIGRVRGCDSVIGAYLEQMASLGRSINASSSLNYMYELSKIMDEQNDKSVCEVY